MRGEEKFGCRSFLKLFCHWIVVYFSTENEVIEVMSVIVLLRPNDLLMISEAVMGWPKLKSHGLRVNHVELHSLSRANTLTCVSQLLNVFSHRYYRNIRNSIIFL